MVRTQPEQGRWQGPPWKFWMSCELCFGRTMNWWWGSQKSICVGPLFIRNFQLYIYLSIYLFIHLSIYLAIYLAIYLSIWLVVSNMFFPIIYGIILPIDFHIFQHGWNHQPDIDEKMLQQEQWGQSHSNSASWSLWVRPFTSLEIYIPSGPIFTVCYWKWPSRNSEFSQL